MAYNIPDWLKGSYSFRGTNKSLYKKRFNKKPKLKKYMTIKEKMSPLYKGLSSRRKYNISKKYGYDFFKI